MKHFVIFTSLILTAASAFACASDMHYDSLSASIAVPISEPKQCGKSLAFYNRFQFDRDLSSLKSMNLREAWLDTPDIALYNSDGSASVTPLDDLSIVQFITVSLVNPSGDKNDDLWLYTLKSDIGAHPTEFVNNLNEIDLRQYIDDFNRIEVAISVSVDPSIAAKYWKNICFYKDNCNLNLPVSMLFNMEE